MIIQNDALLICCYNRCTYLGLYEQISALGDLFGLKKSFASEEKTMDALSEGYATLDSKNLTHIFYARGPGSLTALKLIFIFAHTISLVRGLDILAIDSFDLNDGAPIYAFGNSYFVKNGDDIKLAKNLDSKFTLPSEIDKRIFTAPLNAPLYGLNAL